MLLRKSSPENTTMLVLNQVQAEGQPLSSRSVFSGLTLPQKYILGSPSYTARERLGTHSDA